MGKTIEQLPVTKVKVEAGNKLGQLELWRHSLGHGGINWLPLPQRVVDGAAILQPRLMRIFIQEFIDVYPGEGQFNWSRLDPYMESFAATGAKIVAAICIKPHPLYPKIDQNIYQPTDIEQWQHLIKEMVKRYSVDRPLVTYWEIGNEVDIGEDGGCPYLITDSQDYFEYYKLTIAPILEVFPQAKVGGPASANVYCEAQSGFVKLCKKTNTPLHFISHHLYSSDPAKHAECARHARQMAKDFDHHIEILVTEFSPMFDKASTEDQAFEPHRAAAVGAAILAMMAEGVDWSFHYHLWDQVCYPDDFKPFFSDKGVANMVRHWNEVPHRFGLFGVNQESRPQYYLYQMLSQMGKHRLQATSDCDDIQVLTGTDDGKLCTIIINYNTQEMTDRIAIIEFADLQPGLKQLTVLRIDQDRRWCDQSLQMQPVEIRELWTAENHECHVLVPAGCVALVRLDDLQKP